MSVISGSEAVASFINLNLVKITSDNTGWETLYFNKATKQYWVQSYQNSESHGGGQPQLQQVSELVAKKKFDV